MGAPPPNPRVSLLGLDCGTTTTSAVIASARLERRWATGRVALDDLVERYRSEIVFTPFRGDDLDAPRVASLVDGWLEAAGQKPGELFGGGAIITGLAARRRNAGELARLLRARVGGAVMATADDPCLEAWMAFMGSAASLSRARPDTPLVNVDVGGGTANLALGRGGSVLRTGCLFVGARHIEVVPGTYKIVRLSDQARDLFGHLGIQRQEGDSLAPAEVGAVLDFQVDLLEAEIEGKDEVFEASPIAARLRQVPLRAPRDLPSRAITFSGGVGELIYQALRGAPPPTTCFGDLGIDLAARILASRCLTEGLLVPANTGRAVSYGLLRHSSRLSGATLFLPCPEALPLADMPIVRRLSSMAPSEEIARAVDLARRSARGGCIQVDYAGSGASALKELGQKFACALSPGDFSAERPLVILVSENIGKALGGYITAWGSRPQAVIVLDEIAPEDAQFAQIGRLAGEVVPVSFYGMNPIAEAR